MKSKRYFIILFFTAVVLVILLMQVDLTDAINAIKRANPWYLIAATSLSLLFPVLCAVRWNLIVQGLGIDLGFWRSYKIIMAAWPLGTITPAKSGDLIKLVFLRKVLPYSRTTGVMLAERMMDVIALCTFGILGGIVYGVPYAIVLCGSILLGVVAFFALMYSGWVYLLPEKWQGMAVDMLKATKQIYGNLHTLELVFWVSMGNWFLTYIQTWLCYRAFQVDVPLMYVMPAMTIAIFVGLIPVTLSGMGTRDGTMIFLFKNFASYEISFAVGILYSIFAYWFLSILGLPFMKAAFQGSIEGVSKEDLNPPDETI